MRYNEAYNKIIDAYFKDEIKPFECQFCFCGTLSPNSNWHDHPAGTVPRLCNYLYPYTVAEYGRMEAALFSTFPEVKQLEPGLLDYPGTIPEYIKSLGKKYEEVLFQGMCAALEVLKQIHIKRGEIIDETPAFTKRQLQTA